MQPRIGRRPAGDEGGPSAEDDAGLGTELAAVVAGARRRAVRDGDRQIDTAHLLHSLLESDPLARAAVGTSSQLARLLGYLVQRSIGYGLRWQSAVEVSGGGGGTGGGVGGDPVVVRPARFGGDPGSDLGDDTDGDFDGGFDDAEGWSPAATAAMRDARLRARRRGEPQVHGTDLLAALVTDPRSRAVEVLERAGIPALDLRARIEAAAGEPADGGATC